MVKTRTRTYSSYILMRHMRDYVNESFVLRQDLGDKIHKSKLETKEIILINKSYNDIITGVIGELPFSRWKTFLLKELRQEVLKKDGNNCNVKIENIVLGVTSPSPISNETNTRSFFLNKFLNV